MGCGCAEILKQKASYEHTKELAIKYAKSSGEVVFIYRTIDNLYSFIEATAPEATTRNPIEFISPLQ